MSINRFLAAAAALFVAVLPVHADQILDRARIDNASRVLLPGGPVLGTYSGGKFTSKPDMIQIQGAGSTGDVSETSVPTPSAAAPVNTSSSILAGGTVVPRMNMGALLFNGAPTVNHIPTGNPTLSNGSLVLQTFTTAPDTREIGLSLGMVSNTGAGHSGDGSLGNGDKITLYLGQRALNGSFNTWAFNPLSEIAAGNTTWGGDWIAEFDKNNLAQDVGDAAGPAGLSDKHSWGIQVVAGGTEAIAKRNTAAFAVSSFTTRGQWNRGYLCQAGSARLSCFEDHSNSAASFFDWGTHSVSIDVSNANNSAGAMRLKNGMPIVARSAANTSDISIIYNTSGTTVLGAETNIAIQKQTTVFAPLTVFPGTNPNSTSQPAGTFAATVYNNTNAAGQNGLLAKINFATNAATVFEAGVDYLGGAYASYMTIAGDGTTAIRKAVQMPGLPTNGGTVRGSLCIDTAGLIYIKTSSGACL